MPENLIYYRFYIKFDDNKVIFFVQYFFCSSPTFDWMRRISVRPGKHNRKVSLVFNHLEPMELAEHLSYLEYKAFRRINVGVL